jgi:hypothetical protein
MNAPVQPSYTNHVSPEFLCALDNANFTEHQLAGFSEQTLAIIRQQQAYAHIHPPVAIYRLATQGSRTRDGGVIQQATGVLQITLDNSEQVYAAHKGDYVVYANGSTAQIINGAGQEHDHFALVGSQLSNGDEIINTPQSSGFIVVREGVPMAEDFLPSV